LRTVLHRGEGGWAITQTVTDDATGAPVDLTGMASVTFRLRMEHDSANIIDDTSATIVAPPTGGQVRWVVAVPDTAPLGLADGMWVFSNGEIVPAGQFLIEERYEAGIGGVGVPLASYALTNVQTVKSRVSGMRGQNTVADQLLAYLINAASYEIMDFCEREIKPLTPNPSTRQVWLPSNGYARIPDCQQLTSAAIRVNPDGSGGDPFTAPTSTDAGDYSLAGYWRTTGTFTAITFNPVTSPWTSVLDANYSGPVRLQGNWGWASVPPNISYLCVMTVKAWYEDERIVPQNFTEDLGPAPDVGSVALPGAVRAALNRYRIIPL
jgi:hypothetical protein